MPPFTTRPQRREFELTIRTRLMEPRSVEATFFVGPKGQTKQNAGKVIFGDEEWHAFHAALTHGAYQTRDLEYTTAGILHYEVDDRHC